MNGSVRPSVRLSVTLFNMFPSSHHHDIFSSYYQWHKWRLNKRSRSEVKGQGHRVKTHLSRFRAITPIWTHMWWWNAQSLMLFFKVTRLKIVDFDPNWEFPDRNSSLNSPIALKWYTQLDVVQTRVPIVFQGHPSNVKVTRDKKSPELIVFRL